MCRKNNSLYNSQFWYPETLKKSQFNQLKGFMSNLRDAFLESYTFWVSIVFCIWITCIKILDFLFTFVYLRWQRLEKCVYISNFIFSTFLFILLNVFTILSLDVSHENSWLLKPYYWFDILITLFYASLFLEYLQKITFLKFWKFSW